MHAWLAQSASSMHLSPKAHPKFPSSEQVPPQSRLGKLLRTEAHHGSTIPVPFAELHAPLFLAAARLFQLAVQVLQPLCVLLLQRLDVVTIVLHNAGRVFSHAHCIVIIPAAQRPPAPRQPG